MKKKRAAGVQKAIHKVKVPKNANKGLELPEGRELNDTIRVWDRFKEEAHYWRAFLLIQICTITVSLLVAISLFFEADAVIEVPEVPSPGIYSAKQLPDSEFIGMATRFVNLIATYQPYTASKQFITAERWLWEPAFSEFEKYYVKGFLKSVKEMSQSAIFQINSRQVMLERHGSTVVVKIPGNSQQLLGSRPLPPEYVVYWLRMTTIPENINNQFGLVIIDLKIERKKRGKEGAESSLEVKSLNVKQFAEDKSRFSAALKKMEERLGKVENEADKTEVENTDQQVKSTLIYENKADNAAPSNEAIGEAKMRTEVGP